MKHGLIVTVLALVAVGGIVTGIWYYRSNLSKNAIAYRMAKIQRGDIVAGINATGTIEPEEVINVGAQIAGQI